jgi:hypothetical protein
VDGALTAEVIGRGRACDVLADGSGRVRRRYRTAHAGDTDHRGEANPEPTTNPDQATGTVGADLPPA